MGALQMSESERQEFLADLHVGVFAVERSDGPPLAVPVWYSYEPGGEVVVLTGESSVKARLVATAGRGSLVAQREALPYKYVSVEGPIEVDHLASDARSASEAMAVRYLGEEMGKGYAEANAGGDSLRIRLQPQRWFTVDYSKT